jgi:hypothetical protein
MARHALLFRRAMVISDRHISRKAAKVEKMPWKGRQVGR